MACAPVPRQLKGQRAPARSKAWIASAAKAHSYQFKSMEQDIHELEEKLPVLKRCDRERMEKLTGRKSDPGKGAWSAPSVEQRQTDDVRDIGGGRGGGEIAPYSP